MGVGTAVADRATDASLARGSHRALAWSSVAPDLRFAATAARLPTLILTAVRTTASTVLASCTAGAWSTMEGLWQFVWVWNGELVGQGHGPGGCPGMGQRRESVLI